MSASLTRRCCALTEDVCQRLMRQPSNQQLLERLPHGRIRFLPTGSDHVHPIEVAGEPVEQLHLQPSLVQVVRTLHSK